MADPVLSVALDQTNYAPGSLATLTVSVTDPDRGTLTVHASYTSADGSVTSLDASATIDQGSFSVTSSPPRVWSKESEENGTAVFTTII